MSAAALCALILSGLAAACTGGAGAAPGAVAPQFAYSGPLDWTITGAEGGPFSNSSLQFELSNPGSQPLDWSASAVPAFIQLDPLAGEIPAHGSMLASAQLDGTLAQTLVAGEHSGLLTLQNDSFAQADVSIDCRLSIDPRRISTQLLPLTGFESSGPAGGPFQPAAAVYTLTDTGNTSVEWEAQTGNPWVVVTPASGELDPNATADITVSIDGAATGSHAPGPHSSYVDIVDVARNTTLHSREVALTVTEGTLKDGWTVFTASPDTRKVYVSSSTGKDSHSGLTPALAKRTIAAGKALMRDGYPDWLLLKCGDTWDEAIGAWEPSGRSIKEPTLIGSYGTGNRPLLRTGNVGAIVPGYNTNPNFVSVVGLHFRPHTYTGSNDTPIGVNWIRHTTGFLLEDCFIERYWQNVVVQGFNEKNGNRPPDRHTDVKIRRNVIVDAFSTTSGTVVNVGIYVEKCDRVLIEENLFDHNGWIEGIEGSRPTWFRHNGYVQNRNTDVVLRGNIVAGTDGFMMRSGGIVENNLFLHNYNAILFGLGIDPEPEGVRGTICRNVVLDGRDYGNGNGEFLAGGLCIDMGNVAQAEISENIFANNVSGSGPRPIQIHDAHAYGSWRVVENTLISKNIIHNWGGTALDIQTAVGGQSQQPVNLQIHGNTIQNEKDTRPLIRHEVPASIPGVSSKSNKFHSSADAQAWVLIGGQLQSLTRWKQQVRDTGSTAQEVQFPHGERTIATYQSSIGQAATLQAFLSEARLQSKANWRPQYTAAAVNDYIRAGFGL